MNELKNILSQCGYCRVYYRQTPDRICEHCYSETHIVRMQISDMFYKKQLILYNIPTLPTDVLGCVKDFVYYKKDLVVNRQIERKHKLICAIKYINIATDYAIMSNISDDEDVDYDSDYDEYEQNQTIARKQIYILQCRLHTIYKKHKHIVFCGFCGNYVQPATLFLNPDFCKSSKKVFCSCVHLLF